jgi:hypothetical protein
MLALSRTLWLDRLGATASALCVLHCAAVPVLFLLIPPLTLSLRSWNDPNHGLAIALLATLRWERFVVTGVLVFAAFALFVGYARHRRPDALCIGAIAAVLLVAATVGGVDQPLWIHTTLMIAGGGLLSAGHILNLRLTKKYQSALRERTSERSDLSPHG